MLSVCIDDNGKILGENNVAVNAQDYHKGIVNNNIAEEVARHIY